MLRLLESGAEITRFPDVTDSTDESNDRKDGLPGASRLSEQYVEGVPRLSELEGRVEQLSRELQSARQPSSAEGGGHVEDPQQLRELADWLESLNSLFAKSPWGTRAAPVDEADSMGAQGMGLQDQRRQDELSQLRLQIATLSHKLAQAEDERGQVKGQRPGHRKGAHRPLWKKLARRLGLGGRYRSSSNS